ncbi:FG-GAP repeat domain-containing protein [Streptomyces flavalbus]|uniref:FG-GAP repeat domain-containing protein n=1 Tax=Streptomyces flavalbus TaxID=2665155 RepID=A0ABW2WBL6_9ACTN
MCRRLVAASAVLAAGLTPLLPTPAVADAAQETVVPARLRSQYLGASFRASSTHSSHDSGGARGVFHTLEGYRGLVWTRYADGESVGVPESPAGTGPMPTGTDVLAYKYSDGRVDFWDATDGTTRGLRIPAELGYLTSYDNLTIGSRNVTGDDGKVTREVHLLTPGPDGTTADTRVSGGPAGLMLGLPTGADAETLYFRAGLDGQIGMAAVDRATGEVRGWSGGLPSGYGRVSLGGGHVVVSNLTKAEVLVFPRDLSGEPARITLAGVQDGLNATHGLAVVGDWLVNGVLTMTAQPITGGAPVTLLRSAAQGTVAAPDSTAVRIGTGAEGWGIHRVTPAPDGGPPVVTQVKALPKPPVEIQGLSLEQGRLVGRDVGPLDLSTWTRTVAPTGTPTFGERSLFTSTSRTDTCAATDVACQQVQGTADGRTVWLTHDGTTDRIRVAGPESATAWERTLLPPGGRITDVSGRYVLHTSPSQQSVLRIDDGTAPVVSRAPRPAALSGNTLWSTGTTPGTVTAYDLTARRTTETLTTDAGCAPTELQALGRYLYWTCDGRAGIYDRTAEKSVPVPADEAKLGDGYVVTHDKRAGKLTLTTVAGDSRVIGDLPDTGVSQRDVRWTVDEAGANAAYVDDQRQVHLVPSGVPQQPLRLLDEPRNATYVDARPLDTTPNTLTTVLLSKPSASWRLTVRDHTTGKVVGTRSGGAARGQLTVGWNGDDPTRDGDAFLPNGRYDWSVSVAPADGTGGALTVGGSVRLRKGSPVRHDHLGGDATGDLLTLSSSGSLRFHRGTGTGGFKGGTTGTGWPTTITAVPFGDLSGDRCNDVLVRLSSGALRLYKPGCDAALERSTRYTTLATSGWTQYDVLTAPGDLTRDGRPDLIARNATTGAVYLHKGTSTGKLSSRVKLYDNWKTYKKVIGAGDLNGDGIGDLLAQDKSNNLYRYLGTGNGTFTSRVKLFSDWGASYNAVVGVGDITGDGKADLVSRDTNGNLYRNTGNDKGSFYGRTRIDTGWQGYKRLW